MAGIWYPDYGPLDQESAGLPISFIDDSLGGLRFFEAEAREIGHVNDSRSALNQTAVDTSLQPPFLASSGSLESDNYDFFGSGQWFDFGFGLERVEWGPIFSESQF